MLLFHCLDGAVVKIDPRKTTERKRFEECVSVKRVSILDDAGKRVDLPFASGSISRLWIETIGRDTEIRGERVCYRTRGLLVKATLYYSDKRVVLDIDTRSGF